MPFFKRLTRKKYKLWVRVFLRHYMSAVTCQRCGGSRLREEALHVRVGGLHITDLCQKSVREVQDFFSSLSLTVGEKEIARDGPGWLHEIRKAALAHFKQGGFPTTRDEEWKYTNVARGWKMQRFS